MRELKRIGDRVENAAAFESLHRLQFCVQLACVLDLFSRKIVGWAISDSLETPLVSRALRNAIQSRRPDTTKLLHHSDRGCHMPVATIKRFSIQSASRAR